jgi:hypothetical protein
MSSVFLDAIDSYKNQLTFALNNYRELRWWQQLLRTPERRRRREFLADVYNDAVVFLDETKRGHPGCDDRLQELLADVSDILWPKMKCRNPHRK